MTNDIINLEEKTENTVKKREIVKILTQFTKILINISTWFKV